MAIGVAHQGGDENEKKVHTGISTFLRGHQKNNQVTCK